MSPIQRLKAKANIDAIDVFFLLTAATGYAAFVSWASLIVRAIRGEEVDEDWRVFVSTGASMAAFTLVAGARARETAALRGAAVEMRGLVSDAAEDAQRRDQRAADRDVRDSRRQDRLYTLTKWLVALAALTVAAAVVTLVVSIAR